MANKAVAEEMRTITTLAEEDADVPDALRLIARELDKGGELVGIDVVVTRYEGSEQLPDPEIDEDGNEVAPPISSGVKPQRKDIRIKAQIRSEIAE